MCSCARGRGLLTWYGAYRWRRGAAPHENIDLSAPHPDYCTVAGLVRRTSSPNARTTQKTTTRSYTRNLPGVLRLEN